MLLRLLAPVFAFCTLVKRKNLKIASHWYIISAIFDVMFLVFFFSVRIWNTCLILRSTSRQSIYHRTFRVSSMFIMHTVLCQACRPAYKEGNITTQHVLLGLWLDKIGGLFNVVVIGCLIMIFCRKLLTIIMLGLSYEGYNRHAARISKNFFRGLMLVINFISMDGFGWGLKFQGFSFWKPAVKV